MKSRGLIAAGAAFLCLLGWAPPSAAARGKPLIERGGFLETFDDDFILELCGIHTTTTLTERFVSHTYADGSQKVHVVRTYVSADRRIPIEKGAATSFYNARGVQTVKGTPVHLISSHGTVLIDAGQVTFGDELRVRGPHPSLFVADLAPYYCPS
jgi:hypothetical protein